MLGPAKVRRVDQPVLASLDALVPAHHFYRHLESKLDLTFVRELVRTTYKDGRRPSIDPVIFFNIRALEEAGIRAYVPLSAVGKRSGFFGPEAFTYDAEQDVYTCQNGAVLRFRGNHYDARA